MMTFSAYIIKKMRFKKGRNVSVRDWVTAAANASNDKIFVSVI